ncbi:hypothetical protein JXA88_01375 [Candidatus Fermentibacteria bacterium]|nr:hypothetical protein [Candidatus Fermentibacteria bacterium]
MSQRPTILLLLQLALAACHVGVSAEHVESIAGPEPDSAEVERSERDPVLERSDLKFIDYAGKHIRRMRIRKLDVFGPSVDDTSRETLSRPESLLNHLNFQTRETTIRRTLLFREGDAIDPFRLADSERILRKLGFIGDARIDVALIPGSVDSVDVQVIVKEAWTLRLSGSLKEGNRLGAGLTEQNLLGLGHQVSMAATLTPHATPRLGFDTDYSVQNIHGSFITGKLKYVRVPEEETAGLAFSRELVSPILRYVGGLDLRRTSTTVPDSLPSAADNTYGLVDLWAGRPVHQWHIQREPGRRGILFLSGRLRRLRFTRRPPVTPSTFYQYRNMEHVLGSVTYIQSWYYRANLLYNFGRTEDIPYGLLARVTYGLADEEFTRTHYASATLAAGERISGLGYGIGELRIGGNPRGGEIEHGVIRLRTLYFSRLLQVGGFRFRQFINAEYTAGIHRFADDSIDFYGDESIRGVVYNSDVAGSKRLQLNLETVAFTPWRAQGVTFAFFTFADLDFIGSGRRSILAQDCYSGLGLGVRLHKDGFGIGPVQLRFAWYPRLPIDHDAYSCAAFGEKRFRSIELLGIRPEIVEH